MTECIEKINELKELSMISERIFCSICKNIEDNGKYIFSIECNKELNEYFIMVNKINKIRKELVELGYLQFI